MSMSSRSIAVLLLAVAAACGKGEPAPQQPAPVADEPAAATPTAPEGQVCCESFGHGAQMVKCCESYAWTTAEACTVPPGMVGGGKQIVAAEKCAAP
jgi:hypothetical protein